jgi:glyoxalase/bleomycin resistance protein/dioxygenase superfamily protein
MGPLYPKVDDIGECYGAVLARGFTPSAEPRKDRSGRREFFLPDPDGNRLRAPRASCSGSWTLANGVPT